MGSGSSAYEGNQKDSAVSDKRLEDIENKLARLKEEFNSIKKKVEKLEQEAVKPKNELAINFGIGVSVDATGITANLIGGGIFLLCLNLVARNINSNLIAANDLALVLLVLYFSWGFSIIFASIAKSATSWILNAKRKVD